MLDRLARTYPQALYYQLSGVETRPNAGAALSNNARKAVQEMRRDIKQRNAAVTADIDMIMNELHDKFKNLLIEGNKT